MNVRINKNHHLIEMEKEMKISVMKTVTVFLVVCI